MLKELRLVKDELDLNDWQIKILCETAYKDKMCSGCKHARSVRNCEGVFTWYCVDGKRVEPNGTCDNWIQEGE